jgi:putative tryptophan/tyrosine transport system substrate-binding protein
MRRLITLMGGAAASAWPIMARAQQPERMRRVGVLMGYPEAQSEFASFMYELRKLGWVDGRNLGVDTRWGIPR